jgi:hypothetical protein
MVIDEKEMAEEKARLRILRSVWNFTFHIMPYGGGTVCGIREY